jgi:hypothetical protein
MANNDSTQKIDINASIDVVAQKSEIARIWTTFDDVGTGMVHADLPPMQAIYVHMLT